MNATTEKINVLVAPCCCSFFLLASGVYVVSVSVFLDTVEPCVLAGKLTALSPEVLGAFVDRCQVIHVLTVTAHICAQ